MEVVQEAVRVYLDMNKSYSEELSQRYEELWAEAKRPYASLYGTRCLGDWVGPGWWPLLLEVYAEMLRVTEATGCKIRIQQVKEKFGGLRVYYHLTGYNTDEAHAIVESAVRKAELKAIHTCEMCGEPGHQRDNGWVKTLCDVHDAAQKASLKKRYG